MKCVTAFKAAVLAALLADAPTAALVGVRVYDVRPRDDSVGGAWIYVGPINARRNEFDGGMLWAVTMRIYGASVALQRDEGWNIADAIQKLLHGAQLTLSTGAQAVAIQVDQAGDIVDPLMPLMTFVDISTELHD